MCYSELLASCSSAYIYAAINQNLTLDLCIEGSPMKADGVSTLSMKPSFLISKVWWFLSSSVGHYL